MRSRTTKGNAPAASTAEASNARTQHLNERTEPMNSMSASKNEPASMSLVIGDFTIVQDEQGRYSLNDLHNAAGGAEKHSPRRWLRSQQAIEMIGILDAELTDQNTVLTDQIRSVKTTEGRYGGSFVVKELVYAYAMWISAVFSLRVIRAYDAMVMTGKCRNLSIDMSVTNWARLIGIGNGLMKGLAVCTDMGVAQGQYGTLLQVNRVCGVATPPLERLAPGLRQQLLALEAYDRAESVAS